MKKTMSKIKDVLVYKGYIASLHYSAEDEVFYGRVEHTNDLILFESDTAKGLKTAFEEAIDDYILLCKEKGVEPDKTFKGSFNIRVSPYIHSLLYKKAIEAGTTLNNLITQTLEKELHLSV